jgi:cytochrome c2
MGAVSISFSVFLVIISITALASQTISGNSSVGIQLVRDLNCTACHSLKGQGAGTAPDLGKTMARDYSPSAVAGQIWSHAPAIWSHLKEQGISSPRLTEEQAAALFAYFASARFFEELADAKRGKAVYQDLQCEKCHSTAAAEALHGKAVSSWHSLQDPIALACNMVNRPDAMNKTVAGGKPTPVRLTSQQVADLLVYLRHQPETGGREVVYSLPASFQAGRALLEKEGCTNCHTGNLSFDRFKSRLTVPGFAAAMWNHSPRMKGANAELTCENLTAIAGYLWAIGLFDERGDPARGQRLFTSLGCSSCHNGSDKAAPALNAAQRPFCVYITFAVWNHGPEMLERMRGRGISWPQFTGSKLADLAAFLQQRPAAARH